MNVAMSVLTAVLVRTMSAGWDEGVNTDDAQGVISKV